MNLFARLLGFLPHNYELATARRLCDEAEAFAKRFPDGSNAREVALEILKYRRHELTRLECATRRAGA